MEFLTEYGAGFRSRLLTERQARRYAHCLEVNSHFTNVIIHEHKRTRSLTRYFVTFQPVSHERRCEIATGFQSQRERTALKEGTRFLFVDDPDDPTAQFCLSPSGGEYRVTGDSCTCPDYIHRCSAAGIACKHMVEFRLQQSDVKEVLQ